MLCILLLLFHRSLLTADHANRVLTELIIMVMLCPASAEVEMQRAVLCSQTSSSHSLITLTHHTHSVNKCLLMPMSQSIMIEQVHTPFSLNWPTQNMAASSDFSSSGGGDNELTCKEGCICSAHDERRA